MSRSEFRYNRKRKHYAYLFKDYKDYKGNILLSTKPYRKWHNKTKKNIKLYKHPNSNSKVQAYIISIIYIDHIDSFDLKKYDWRFNINDKRKIKRIIHNKKYKK